MPDAPRRPNILLIVIDDLGWADLGCYGSDFYETPNLDRLAARGVRFTDAYAACPVCSPTRASLQTGRYPARVGITNFIPGNAWGKLMGVPFFDALPRGEVTLAQALAPAGYRRYHVGKWHLGGDGHGPEDFGYEVNVGGGHMGAPSSYFSPYRIPTLRDGPDGEYLTDRLTDEALSLTRKHSEGGEQTDAPFLMHLAHYAVHTPIQSPPELVEKYRRKTEAMGRDPADALVEGEAFPCLHKRGQRVTRRVVQSDPAYAAMVENLDTNLGRLFDGLENQGLADDTLILFTSDNGGLSTAEGSPTCNAPLREGKGWMNDGGNRVCLIASPPESRRPESRPPESSPAGGTTCVLAVTSPDVFSTVLDAAGVEPDTNIEIDGRSFLGVLQGETLEERPIFWHYPHYSNQGGTPTCAVRHGDHKLIEYFEDGRLELFDVRRDPGEHHELSAEQPERVRQLHDQLVAWRKNIEAKIPEVNPHHADMVAGRMPRPDGHGRIPGGDHP